MSKPRVQNWLVLWAPLAFGSTVDTMKVIDAWSSTNGNRAGAMRHAEERKAEYLAKHGDGCIQLVEHIPRSRMVL